jgi:carboxymethylenebutenolidase
MERKKASDFPQELLNLFDVYVHGGMSRRGFLDRAQKFATLGVSAAALFEMLRPNYAWAIQVPPDDSRITARFVTIPSPEGDGAIKGYLVRPANADKLPAVLVVHENRGLNPYIEDVARRLALANFIAFAPDGLTSVGGYPGDDEKGAELFRRVDPVKMQEDFAAAARWLKSLPDSTGKLGAIGFCFGGGVVNQLAVRMGSDLDAAVPFYGVQPDAADAAKDQGADQRAIWRTRSAHHQRLAGLRRRPRRGGRSARGSHLQRRQPRLPQRHDAALRSGGGRRSLAADDRLAQQISAGMKAL